MIITGRAVHVRFVEEEVLATQGPAAASLIQLIQIFGKGFQRPSSLKYRHYKISGRSIRSVRTSNLGYILN